MDFDGIVRSAYSWISVGKVIWFVAFFWISLPFIIILPQLFASGAVYSSVTKPLAILLYDVLYVALIIGVVLLIQHCLVAKREKISPLGVRKVIGLVFLVFVELFYVFVWNINAKLRNIQLLLVISSALLGYLFIASMDWVVLVLFSWSLLAYSALAIRNFVMLFFSTSIFCNKDFLGIKGSIKESWAITHGRVADTFSAIIVSLFLAFVLFAFVTLALGAVSSLFLRFFFIDTISISLGFKVSMAFGLGIALIAYHFMIADVFTQLERHRAASNGIKKILARRVLSPFSHRHVGVRRPLKRSVKKKRR